MKRTLRLWTAAVLAVVLSLPAAPAFAVASQGEGHDCCVVLPAHAASGSAGDCSGDAAAHHTTPVCGDAGKGGGPGQSSSCCVHCAVAAVHAAYAYGSLPAGSPVDALAYVLPFQVAPFLPAARVDRLERPPKAFSF